MHYPLSTNFLFSRLIDHGAKECKGHLDLTEKKLQRTRDKWNEDRMKQLDFINKRLLERNEARACIKNVDEAMVEYYRVFGKKKIMKPLAPEPELSDFYHPSETQKNGEILFVVVSTGIAIYALYRYIKKLKQTRTTYIKHTINLIVFGLVVRQ